MRHKEIVFDNKSRETPDWIAQRGSGCPIPERIQGQAIWDSDQTDLVENVPAHGRNIWTR